MYIITRKCTDFSSEEVADLGHREILAIEPAGRNMFDMLHRASNRSLLEP